MIETCGGATITWIESDAVALPLLAENDNQPVPVTSISQVIESQLAGIEGAPDQDHPPASYVPSLFAVTVAVAVMVLPNGTLLLGLTFTDTRMASGGCPPPYRWLRLYWKRALADVGADTTLRLHDLRHLTAQLLVNAGQSEASVQSTMRHATASMTRRYAMQKDRGENAAALAKALLDSKTA